MKIINTSFSQECLLCEVILDDIKGYIALFCTSPNHNSADFQHFMYSFEQLIISIEVFKPNFIVLLDDCSAQSKAW